jgi:hypothetical protein
MQRTFQFSMTETGIRISTLLAFLDKNNEAIKVDTWMVLPYATKLNRRKRES